MNGTGNWNCVKGNQPNTERQNFAYFHSYLQGRKVGLMEVKSGRVVSRGWDGEEAEGKSGQ